MSLRSDISIFSPGILKLDFLPGEDIEVLPHVFIPLPSFMFHEIMSQKEDKTLPSDSIQKRYLMKIF